MPWSSANFDSDAVRRLLYRFGKNSEIPNAATGPPGPLESILKKLDLNYVPGPLKWLEIRANTCFLEKLYRADSVWVIRDDRMILTLDL